MALGSKAGAVTNNLYDQDVAIDNSYHPDLLKRSEHDPERKGQRDRKMSRVVPLMADSDVESAVSVGKQLELESENQIKYRTCSWQKVNRMFLLIPGHHAEYSSLYFDIQTALVATFLDLIRGKAGCALDLTFNLDRCSAILRVHLPGHHVISIFVFSPGLGSWTDCDCGRRSFCLVYFLDSLVSLLSTALLIGWLTGAGSSAFVTRKFETSAIWARCCISGGGGSGI